VRPLLVLPLLFGSLFTRANGPVATFVENRGQWPQAVLYKARIPGGALFVERDGLTFAFVDHGFDHRHHGQAPAALQAPRAHAYRIDLVGGRAHSWEGLHRRPGYENYFLGSDPAAWGTGCAIHGGVLLRQVWPGIDLRIDGTHGLKYDLLLAAGADPGTIRLRYSGQDALMLTEERLLVTHSLGQVTEDRPVAFQPPQGDGSGAVVAHPHLKAAYLLNGQEVGFAIEGYDPALPLVIDPNLTFSSYSGSTADNFGFTATYDDQGHLYGAGIVFGTGYPTTIGAYDPTFNGGVVDVGVSKWSSDGSTLVWSTYLGGLGNEAPHSMVANTAGELYIMGSTGSGDFPTTPGCLQTVFQGGPSVTFAAGYGFSFPLGADIFLTHLNAAGTALVGSTYLGGAGSDGINNSSLAYNYGDAFRGEVALDPQERPVVISSTNSPNLPTTPGAPQPTYGGGDLDAYVFRMDPGLSTLLWATYYGGTGQDAGHGVQFDSNGQVFITGGTTSPNLPMAGTPFIGTNSGGTEGYIARFNAAGNALLSATYIGTSANDQCYFVQLDTDDNVYVVGQTKGNYPVSPGVYANPGSSQFIHKLAHDLDASIWSTRIGNGNINQDLSPSAFLVSDCRQIYFSAWGGSTNNIAGPSSSTTSGSPVTPDALQPTTNGSDFYLMVLEPDAVGLNYATFFGGATTNDHVDGGTSRFDKNGTVYQAVCAGCGNSNSFPTTPGAWSNTNNSSNCNLGVFKLDLTKPLAVIGIDGPTTICFPSTVQFTNNSVGGDTYTWNFGDGTTSTGFAPVHTYTAGGTFTVSLVLSDSQGCAPADTAYLEIVAVPAIQAVVDPVAPLCPGGSTTLTASDGDSWSWFPPDGLSATDVQAPLASPSETTTYGVAITTFCGTDTAYVDVVVLQPSGSVLPDVTICLGDSTQLGATGGALYTWEPPLGLNDPNSPNPMASPPQTTTYVVLITTAEGCTLTDSLTVLVIEGLPTPVLADTAICNGASVTLTGPAADSHVWQGPGTFSSGTAQTTTITPSTTGTFTVTASNACGSIVDAAFITLVNVIADAWPDTIVCPGNPVPLQASGGILYAWSPASGLDDPAAQNPVATVFEPTTYTVQVTDALGCQGQASLAIGLLPPPAISTGPGSIIDPWGQAVLTVHGDPGTIQWEPAATVLCPTCPQTWAGPDSTTLYTVTVTAGNGCTSTATVLVIVNGSLYVPNTFTPNGDGVNDFFGARGEEIAEFQMDIFDRWGELLHTITGIDGRWDGNYRGEPCPIGVYVWKFRATERSGHVRAGTGHVTLVR
jgi:gliding motility-associated-like protein